MGYVYAENVETEGYVGRRIVRETDGAACLAMIIPVRTATSIVCADRLDAAIAARAHQDFKTRMAVAAVRAPQTIPQLATKYGLYAVQIIRWKNEFLKKLETSD
ncbi:hypothetical protein LZC95_30090 [Pendulispora brunnea]|uniref:Transposase n=1 Tax=Pendulispora brunnea TaxID=2905690 RepID=A0ABZ2JW45_9BACT